MPVVQERAIAAALAALMRTRHVTAAQVAARSGIARNTIGYILSGKTARPKARTLQALARVLAMDAWTGELDTDVMTENERVLAVAAGYAAPTAREVPTHLELSLYYRLASRDRARAWLDVIDALAGLSPDDVRGIPGRLGAGGGGPNAGPDG